MQVAAADGSQLVLDAGTGIRELGTEMAGRCRRLDLLLTHLHLDHIQGLMFFTPFFDPEVEVTIWGPPAAGRTLASLVAHRGTTLGYRLSENGTSLCYLPDHEPALGQDLASSRTSLDLRARTRARRVGAAARLPVLLLHHDPEHDDDFLDAHDRDASECWAQLGCAGRAELGREGDVIDVSE